MSVFNMNECHICKKKCIVQYICPICHNEYCEKHIYSHICYDNENNYFSVFSLKSIYSFFIQWVKNQYYNLSYYSYISYISIIIYLLYCFSENIIYNLCFFSNISSLIFEPWRIITYMFVHGSFIHLFFNLIALNLFGSFLEKRIGKNLFLISYIFCGIFAAIFHFLFSSSPLIGSSGSIFGLLSICSLISPNMTIFINFIPMKLKNAVIAIFLFDLFFGVFINDNIAHFSHIGGLLFGIIIGRYILHKEK